MKVKIYVDWSRQEIMNQKEGEAELASHLNDKESYEDYRGTYLNDIIEDWLKNQPTVHYTEFYKKLFELSAEERAEIEAKCRESYEEQLSRTSRKIGKKWKLRFDRGGRATYSSLSCGGV